MPYRLVLAGFLGVTVLVMAAVWYWVPDATLSRWVNSVREAGPWAVVVFVGVSVALSVVLVPGMLTTLAGGALFGIWLGFVASWVAGVAAALVCFAISRWLGRARVAQWLEGKPKVEALDRAIQARGVRVVVLARLSPLLPYPLLNYAMPLTRVSFRDFAIGSLVGMVPLTFATAYAGAMMGSVSRMLAGGGPDRGTWQEVGFWGGLVATVALTWLLVRVSKRELRKAQQAA